MNLTKYLSNLFRPKFWSAGTSENHNQNLFNYRRFWFFSVLVRAVTSLVPMVILLIFIYIMESKAIKNEKHMRTVRLTSNTRRTITYFLEERLDALKFITQENTIESLKNPDNLSEILKNLKMGFGGFLDIGLIDDSGLQVNYAGPFQLKGKKYRDQKWFSKCMEAGLYVSDVFLGHRKLPHMIIALKLPTQKGQCFILRATLDIQKLTKILSSLELSEKSEAFLCNRQGLLQTPSKYHGKILQKIDLIIPEYALHSQVIDTFDKNGDPILIGYAFIENSPFILMVVKKSEAIMKDWQSIHEEIKWFFNVSVIIIIIIVLAISTYMVNKIYDADQTRLRAMTRLESSSRLISIGRLAAGVAHEINNPLSIIGENAGYIKDLFLIKKEYKNDQRLMELNDNILESVERCGEITKELLEFTKHLKTKIQPLELKTVISKVLKFFRRTASYDNINIKVNIADDVPVIYSDDGSLQQILFNLINNSFQAMSDGGRLDISANKKDEEHVVVSIGDSGCGISKEDQKKIFEPFFTTKDLKGGTGLGMFITYRLVRKLEGDISLRSEVGKGTTFTITLSIKAEGDIQSENPLS